MPITTPRYKRLYHSRTVPGAGVFLLTETLPTVLNGQLNDLVCPLIDGERSADDIARMLADRVSMAEVYYTLNVLEQRGFIEEAASAVDDQLAAFWQANGIDPDTAVRRLAANPVTLVAVGNVSLAPMHDALRDAGVVLDPAGRMTVAVTDDYRRPELLAIDARAREARLPWAIVKPVGTIGWIGPFMDPRTPSCWRCLVDRIRLNYPVDTFLEEQGAGSLPLTSTAALPSAVLAISALAASEVAKWIARQGETPFINQIMTFSAVGLEQNWHAMTWRPPCFRCGEGGDRSDVIYQREPAPLVLESRLITASDGSHRTATAEETLERWSQHVSPITGVVSRLADVSPPGHPLVHAFSASHNWATHPDSLAFLKQTLRSQSGGKGTNRLQARVGAIAEAFERYAGVFRGDEVRRRATLAAMGPDAIHPNRVMLFSDRQYERRQAINAEGNSFQMVPNPLLEDRETDWSPMWAPTAEAFRWLPTGLLYYGYSKAVPHEMPNRLAAYADSNGTASGNSLEEAALQALMELVERDAVATWWYSQVQRPAIELADIDHPYLRQLLAWLPTIGRDLWALDITNDVGIPVVAAFSRIVNPGPDGEQLVVGFGAHLDPAIAAMRAITEVNQFFASLFALGDRDLARAFDPGAVDWWRTATRDNKPYSQPNPLLPIRRLADFPALTSPDLREEVLTAIRQIEACGPEVLLLDQTRPDIGFPVIKALAPGLRHFWRRLGPGRLYDVPLALGWLDHQLTEDELNPVPVFF